MKGEFQSLVNYDSVERWINGMGEHEICKEMLPVSAS